MTQFNRHGEDAARTQEKGHAEAQPTSKTTAVNSTAPTPERGIYNPLRWRTEKPARPHSEYGRTTPEALAWMAITGLMMLAGWLWEAAR